MSAWEIIILISNLPLASPPSSNDHQAVTHQECHLQLSGKERTSYKKHAYNV